MSLFIYFKSERTQLDDIYPTKVSPRQESWCSLSLVTKPNLLPLPPKTTGNPFLTNQKKNLTNKV
jgi:hypothetical protein